VIRVSDPTYRSAWGLAAVVVAAGWGLFGLIGHGSMVFLSVMVVVSGVAFAGLGLVLRRTS
jgi:hypothetical protein